MLPGPLLSTLQLLAIAPIDASQFQHVFVPFFQFLHYQIYQCPDFTLRNTQTDRGSAEQRAAHCQCLHAQRASPDQSHKLKDA